MLSAQEIAERSAAALLENDAATEFLGVTLAHVSGGKAVMYLDVATQHLNGHNIMHGGFLFTLADTCFAVACNSYNQKYVSQHGEITYLAPAYEGDKLTAEAREISRQGRTGVYDIEIRNQDDTLIALFRGLCRSIKGSHFTPDDTDNDVATT